jgi:hypothetical protein
MYFLATPLGKKEKGSATMVNLPKPREVDLDNIARLAFGKLSAKDCEAYEAYMKERERKTYDAKEKKMKKQVDGSYLTSP